MIKDLDINKQPILLKSDSNEYELIQKYMEEHKQTLSMFIHELRNPLSLMKGTLQYIEMKHPETKDYKYWSQLLDLTQDMENMLSNVSLLNSCTTPIMSKTNLLTLIRDSVENYMPQANNQKKQLFIREDSNCESMLSSYCCDSAKIRQVMSNLLKNAFEATTPGDSIEVIISTYQTDLRPMISIQVANNGQPIPEDDIDTIFNPFVTYKKEGTGIGLSFVKNVIRCHGGSIQVSSNEELTCFTILLPLPS